MAGSSNYRTLDDLQARLDPDVFWRVHRSHLVNINKIKEIVPWFSRNYILRMKDAKGTEIPVSRSADQAASGIPEAISDVPTLETPPLGDLPMAPMDAVLAAPSLEAAGCPPTSGSRPMTATRG